VVDSAKYESYNVDYADASGERREGFPQQIIIIVNET
jgi:hypothetical protein